MWWRTTHHLGIEAFLRGNPGSVRSKANESHQTDEQSGYPYICLYHVSVILKVHTFVSCILQCIIFVFKPVFLTLGVRVGRLWPRKWLYLPLSPSFKGQRYIHAYYLFLQREGSGGRAYMYVKSCAGRCHCQCVLSWDAGWMLYFIHLRWLCLT